MLHDQRAACVTYGLVAIDDRGRARDLWSCRTAPHLRYVSGIRFTDDPPECGISFLSFNCGLDLHHAVTDSLISPPASLTAWILYCRVSRRDIRHVTIRFADIGCPGDTVGIISGLHSSLSTCLRQRYNCGPFQVIFCFIKTIYFDIFWSLCNFQLFEKQLEFLSSILEFYKKSSFEIRFALTFCEAISTASFQNYVDFVQFCCCNFNKQITLLIRNFDELD